MLQEIGEIVVLGLKSREDRWQRCIEIFKENKITKVTHYTTVQDFEDTYQHAKKDFINLLRLKKGQTIVFFEDDFELVKDWELVLRKALEDLPESFDMLYLGANLTKTPERKTANLLRIRGAWCLHGVVMSAKFIDYVLESFDVNGKTVFDEWCRQIAESRRFYMTYPMICYQRKSFSDYVGQYVDYDLFNNKYYKEV
jgi:hypothetical protein